MQMTFFTTKTTFQLEILKCCTSYLTVPLTVPLWVPLVAFLTTSLVAEPSLRGQESGKIYEYLMNLLSIDGIKTEENAYILLKNGPLPRGVNYLAIPLVVLLNKPEVARSNAKLLASIKVDGGFAVCQHIRFEVMIPLLKNMGIDTLFTPHAVLGKKYEGITVVPFPHYAVNGCGPAAHKDILYSFIGFDTHWTRQKIFTPPQQPNIIIKRRGRWHFSNSQAVRTQEKKEYQDVLSRSRFSLCPRGTGPSTVRFWESLQAGAIPVLISDATALPTNFDWERCVIRIAETDVMRIPAVIASISEKKEAAMREACFEAYEAFSGPNFISAIRNHYAALGKPFPRSCQRYANGAAMQTLRSLE